MQANGTQKVTLINSRKHSKTMFKRVDRQSLVQSPFMKFSQKTEQVYSYNPGDHTGMQFSDRKGIYPVKKLAPATPVVLSRAADITRE